MSEQHKNDGVMMEENRSTVEEDVLVPVEQPEADRPESLPSPGLVLARHRQEKGLDVDDVARSLKLAQRQIVALEADDYTALPGMVITRGFIRSYAKLLDMDAAPLLAALPKEDVTSFQESAPRVLSAPFEESKLPLRSESGVKKIVLWSVAGIAALAVLYFVFVNHDWIGRVPGMPWHSSEEVQESVDAPQAAEPAVTATEGKVATLSLPTPVVNQVSDVASAPDASATKPMVPVAPPLVSVPAVPVTPVVSDDKDGSRLRVSQSKDLLRLEFKEDSWIEIRRESDGSLIFSRLLQAGTTESFDVSEPVQLVVGNASGVAATLRGQTLTLPVSKNNVSRLSVK